MYRISIEEIPEPTEEKPIPQTSTIYMQKVRWLQTEKIIAMVNNIVTVEKKDD